MSCAKDLSNDIFDLQWLYKTTAAFVVNNFLSIIKQVWYMYIQTYIRFAHIFALYFDVKLISQNSQKPTVPEPLFY